MCILSDASLKMAVGLPLFFSTHNDGRTRILRHICIHAAGAALLVLLLLLVVLFLSSVATSSVLSRDQDTVVRLLFAVWRHGDKVPSSTYPGDPYKESDYDEAIGHLNAAGRRRAWELGRYIGKRYGSFLGEQLLPELVELRSTTSQRAVQSGRLVLAGAFGMKEGSARWNASWGYVQVTAVQAKHDNMLTVSDMDCPPMRRLLLEEAKKVAPRVEELVTPAIHEVLATHARVDPTDLEVLAHLTDTLTAQLSCGLPLPGWAHLLYPQPAMELEALFMRCAQQTREERRLLGGVFLNEVLGRSREYESGQLPAGRKLLAYSAHDTSELALLSALGVWDGAVPTYSSAIFVELQQRRNGDGALGFQIYYRNDASEEPVALTLPGCDFFCPLDTFRKLYEEEALTSEEQFKLCDTRILN